MNIRGTLFWAKDRLTGGKMRNEVTAVKSLNRRDSQSATVRLRLLHDQLQYVTDNVAFYRPYADFHSLSDMPVLNKEFIREHRSEMISEGTEVEAWHETSTSGSTGTPFRVYHDPKKRLRINAETIYFGEIAGYEVGTPLWHLKIWTDRNRHSFISALLKNIKAKDVSSFNEDDVPQLLANIGKNFGRNSIISYSSCLETIAKVLVKNEGNNFTKPKVYSIIGQSEPMSFETRKVLHKHLGVFPVARYGMEEVGIIAQQEPGQDDGYRLNLASTVVEVLKMDSDESVEVGEIGRIVVTDLVNRAQPLIRYDTGDLCIVASFLPGTKYAESFERLDGRERDRLFDVNDRPLAPMIAYNFWWKFREILQYQIVQEKKGKYILRIEVSEQFGRQEELIQAFKEQVGTSAEVEIEISKEGYRHSSGKRKVIVSNYQPTGDV